MVQESLEGLTSTLWELLLLLGGILSASGRGKLRTQDQEVLEELRVAFPCAAVTSAPSLYPRQEFCKGSLCIVGSQKGEEAKFTCWHRVRNTPGIKLRVHECIRYARSTRPQLPCNGLGDFRWSFS